MATPDFIVQLREKVGHAPLWLPGVTAIVIRDVPPNAPMYALPEVLLVRRSDNGEWTPVTGIIDPNEQPHDAAVREVKEETGLDVTVEALLGTGAVGPVEYPNGDVTSYVDVAMRCSVVGDDVPYVADDESTEVGWFQISQMPPMKPRFRLIVADAVAQLKHPAGFKPRMGYHKREK
ncbi:NUDIX hydrolase [Corynebacterium vitaeruminis]|uniref:NUDIX hydrolase n=1 Tax=Corynebacterium vitaeruminis TaxID=38305 RepID=UPI00066037EA|nr:NUDIX domain-containing protein [Corynebacterium vitaeruminis]